MKKLLVAATVSLALLLGACGSYVQRINANGVVCIVQRDEINNHVKSVKCPRPYTVGH